MADTTAHDRDARRLRSRGNRIIDEITGTGERIAKAVRTAREEFARIDSDERLAPDAKADDRAAAERRLMAAVDDAEKRVRRASAKAEELLDGAVRADTDTRAALLDESRLARAWRRTERLLEAGEDPTIIAQRATEAGDRDTVAALRDELGPYLLAKGRGAEVGGAMLELEYATAPLASPVERATSEVREAVERARRDAAMAISWVRRDGVEATEIPGPDGLIPVWRG